ncbi:MAG: PLD nuclease N-terminal domain-containing protein [Actinomycetota bacterium]|nr:PLD nuclease N-terminal domain-containing protein [Actinomycetota bacterium]
MRYLPFLLVIGLVIYTVVDVVNAEDDDRLGVHPALWILGIVLLPPLGSIAWLAVRFSRRSNRGAARPGPSGPPRQAYRPGPAAPDDDPEFLWRLEQEKRRREREQEPNPES